MANTFDGLAFYVLATDSVPLPEREVIQSVRPIPYSDSSVRQVSGLGPLTFRATIVIDLVALASWQTRRGQSGALVVADTAYGTVTLVAFASVRRVRGADYIMADVELGA